MLAASGPIIRLVCVATTAYLVIMLARVIWSWFPAPMGGPLRTVYTVIHDVTEPVLRPLRNMIPPLRLGVTGLDMSPIIVFVVLAVIRGALRC